MGIDYSARRMVKGLTVDGETSKDLDDAIWVETWGDRGTIEIHLADPTGVIPLDSDLEREARRKIATRYLRRGNEPMLPRELSEGALSLFPGVVRPTLTVRVRVDRLGQIVEREIFESRLVSIAQLSYEKVELILQRKLIDDLYFPLKQAEIWSSVLNLKRSQQGAIGSIMKNGFFTDEEGRIIEGVSKAQVLVSEYMLLANTVVADWLREKQLAAIYRNHAPIASESKGLRVHLNNSDISHEERSQYYHLLGKAKSSQESTGHFALALDNYLHFTSPLRRFSDFINHRIVKAAIEKSPSPYSDWELQKIAGEINAHGYKQEEWKKNCFQQIWQEKIKAAEDYRDLSPQEILKTIAISEVKEEPLNETIQDRINQNILTDKEILAVLFKTDFVSLKQIVFDSINEQDYVRILNLAPAIFEEVRVGFSELPRETQEDPHEVELTVCLGEESTVVRGQGPKKKMAKSEAARDWLATTFLGESIPKSNRASSRRSQQKEVANYANLSAKELFKLIVSGEAKEDFLSETIQDRINQNILSEKEILAVFFKTDFVSLKQLIFDSINEQDYARILNLAPAVFEEVTIEFQELPHLQQTDPHEVELTVCRGEELTMVRAQGPNKKMARAKAAKEWFCKAFLGVRAF